VILMLPSVGNAELSGSQNPRFSVLLCVLTEDIKMIHDLKIEDNYLENLVNGGKKSEIRINDRDYQKGDLLRFRRYSYAEPKIKEFIFEVSHIHSGLGLKENYVVLSIHHVNSDT